MTHHLRLRSQSGWLAEQVRIATYSGRLDACREFAGAAEWPALRRCIVKRLTLVAERIAGRHAAEQRILWNAVSLYGCIPATDGGASGESFQAYMLEEGWTAICERLPCLQPLLLTVLEHELDAARELLSRARKDRRAIASAFAGGRDPGALAGVRLGLSDPHNGRRSVACLRFSGGLQVIYKPRPVAMEAGYADIAAWLRRAGAPYAPKAPHVLDREDHGWAEFIPARACRRLAGVDMYYTRLGMLACLLAALGATDCHAENIIADGAHPVLADAETLVHPRLMASPAYGLFETELFARDVPGPNGQNLSYGGFDSTHPGDRELRASATAQQWPAYAGVAYPMAAYRAAVLHGVAGMAQFLRRNRTAFLGEDGPLARLSDRHGRIVLRPTSMYAVVLQRRSSREFLQDAPASARDASDWLAPYNDPIVAPHVWEKIRRAEAEAVSRLDVPYFLCNSLSGDILTASGGCAGRKALTSPITALAASFDAVLASAEEFSRGQKY